MSDNITKLLQTTILSLFLGGSVVASAWLIAARLIPAQPDAPQPIANLSQLLETPEDAAKYGRFYLDLSAVVRAGYPETTGQFRNAHKIAAKCLQDAGELGSAAKVNDPISKQIEKAIGLDDRSLDAGARTDLADALESVASQLGVEVDA